MGWSGRSWGSRDVRMRLVGQSVGRSSLSKQRLIESNVVLGGGSGGGWD